MIFVFALTLLCKAIAWTCGTTPNNTPDLISISSRSRRLDSHPETQLSSEDSIRLFFYNTEGFTLDDSSSQSLLENEIIPGVKEFFAARLKVNRIEGPLALENLSTICNGEVAVPTTHQDPGVPDTDIIIYMKSVNDPHSEYTASASPCVNESGSRTNVLAGQITINSANYNAGNFADNFAVMVHETVHVLGFVNSAYEKFMKADGSLYTLDELTEVVTLRGVTKRVYKGPGVLERARRVYNCWTMQGLEFEDVDGDPNLNLLNAHWDARVVYNEIMTAFITEESVYSEFTFGLLEDSGWYSVDWNYPETPQFGNGKGCDFINELCISNSQAAFEPEFCAAHTPTTCNFYHTGLAYCDRQMYNNEISQTFQYFSEPTEGGQDYPDFCPVRRSYLHANCMDANFQTYEELGETSCVNCKCMTGSLIQDGLSLIHGDIHASCYELIGGCEVDAPVFRIGNPTLGYFEATCYTGETITAPPSSGFNGYLNCPDTDIICGRHNCLNSCYGRGKCADGKCECQSGRGGDDCSIVCHESCFNCTGPSSDECTGCSGSNREVKDGTCVCSYGFEEVEGECFPVSSECTGLCATCNLAVPTECFTCIENSSRVDSSSTFGVCACSTGYTEVGTMCRENEICQGLCDTCDPLDGNACLTCKFNSSRIDEEETYGDCQCDMGYTKTGSFCISSSTDSFFFDSESLDIQGLNFSTRVPSSSTNPTAVPYNGLWFTDSQALELVENDGKVKDYSTLLFSTWTRLQFPGGILLQAIESESMRSLVDTIKLEFSVTSSSDLRFLGQFSNPYEVSASTVLMNTWTNLGFSIIYDSNSQLSEVKLYIDDTVIYEEDVTGRLALSEPSGIFIGGSPFSLNSIAGFILSIQLSQDASSTSIFDSSTLCVNYPYCNLLPSACDFDEILVDNECEYCNCDGGPCARLTDCKLNIDPLCQTFTSFYSCDECIPQASIAQGLCQCDANSAFDEKTQQCVCNSGYIPNGNACVHCNYYFTPDMISIVVSDKFTHLDIFFSHEVIERSSSCSDLFLPSSLEDLGTNPICTWFSSIHLELELGANFNIDIGYLSLNPEAFIYDTCDNPRQDLNIEIVYIGDVPVPKAHINGVRTLSLNCWYGDLVLTGEGSTGLTHHTLKYDWSVSSDPSNLSLATHVESIDASTVEIPSELLSEGVHEFTLTVTNVFGLTDSTTHVLNVSESTVIPISFDPSYHIETDLRETLEVKASALANCSKQSRTTYKWIYEGTAQDTEIAAVSNMLEDYTQHSNILVIDPGLLAPGYTYIFKMTATSGKIESSETLSVTVVKPDLVSVITKLSGQISNQEDLVLDGSASYDPISSSTKLLYNWSCVGNCPSLPNFSEPQIVIPSSLLEIGSTFVFILTVSDGERSNFSQVEFAVVDLAPSEIPKPEAHFVWNTNENLLLEIEDHYIGDIIWYQVLGDTIIPSTPNNLSYIKFAKDQFSEGQYYGWEVQFINKEGKTTKELFTWRVIAPVDCLSELTINYRGNSEYMLKLENCESQDQDDKPYKFSFGHVENEKEVPLSGLSSNNYFQIKIPRGIDQIYTKICDSDNECSIKYSVIEHKDLMLTEEIGDSFIKDIADPERIPSSIYFYAVEYTLNKEEWDMMYDALEGYMLNQSEENSVSACVVALSSLLSKDIVSPSKAIFALQTLGNMVTENKLQLSALDLQNVYESLDNLLKREKENTSLIYTLEIVLHSLLSYHMQDTPPFDLPVIISSKEIYSFRQRVMGDFIPGNTFSFNSHYLDFPEALPFDSTDIVDLYIMIIGSEDPIYDINFIKTGVYENNRLKLTEKETVFDLEIKMTVPNREEYDNAECLSLLKSRWKSSGCSVIEVEPSIISIYVKTDSIIQLKASMDPSYDFIPLYTTIGLVIIMGIFVAVRGLKKKHMVNAGITNAESNPNIKDPKTLRHDTFPKRYIEDDLPENPVKTANKSKVKVFYEEHLLIGQCSEHYLSPIQRALLLFTGLFVCMSVSGLCGSVNQPEFVLDFVLNAFLSAVLSSSITIGLDLCKKKMNTTVRYVVMVSLISCSVIANLIIVAMLWTNEFWMISFALAYIIDSAISQSVYSLMKTLVTNN